MSDIAVLGLKIENGHVVATTAALDKMTAAGGRAETTTNRLSAAAKSLGMTLAAYLSFRALLSGFNAIATATREAELAQVRLAGVMRATGNAAGYTAGQLDELATVMSRTTLFDDESIKNAAARLATFGNITGEVFGRTLALGADLATLLGEDITGATFQLGKALEDPVRGLTLLKRAGMSFTAAENDMVKAAIAHNDVRGAQAVMLDSIQRRIGGLAGGAHTGLTGAMHDLKLEWGNFLETLGQTPGIASTVANAITTVADAIQGLMLTLAPTRAMQEEALRAQYATANRTLGLAAGQGPMVGETQEGFLRRMAVQAAAVDDLARRIDALRGASVAEMRARGAAAALAEAQAHTLRAVTEGTAAETAEVGKLKDQLKALHAEKERSVALDRAMLEAAGAYVDRVVAGLNRQLEMYDELARMTDKNIAALKKYISMGKPASGGARVTKDDLVGALPTIGGIDLASLLKSPKSFGLELLSSGLGKLADSLFGGAEAARAAAAAERALIATRVSYLRTVESTAAGLGFVFDQIGNAKVGIQLLATVHAISGLDQELAQSAAQFTELRDRAREMYSGTERLAFELERIRSLEAAVAARLRAEYALKQLELQQDYAVRAMRAVGMDAEADAAAFAQAQQREMAQAIRDGADAATQATLRQTLLQEAIRRTAEVAIAAARKEADAAAQRLASAQSALDATKATLSGLQAYSASLRGLTGSPASNLASSRAAFEALAARARGGDAEAVAGLQGAGTAFLEQSRAYNASGMGYQRDVASVQAVVDEVAATYQATATAQESMVALLTEQNRIAAASLKALQDAEFVRQHEAAEAYYATAYTTAQAANDPAGMLAALAALRTLGLAQIDRAVTDMLALQGTVGAAMAGQVAQTILALEAQREATTAAFDRTAVAIVAGFPVTDVSALYSNAMAAMHQNDLIGALASQAGIMGAGNAMLGQMLTQLMWIADPSTRPASTSSAPIDPGTGEPYGGAWDPSQLNAPMAATATNTAATVTRLETSNALLLAGFETLSNDLAVLTAEVGKLTVATRKTGEALAVA